MGAIFFCWLGPKEVKDMCSVQKYKAAELAALMLLNFRYFRYSSLVLTCLKFSLSLYLVDGSNFCLISVLLCADFVWISLFPRGCIYCGCSGHAQEQGSVLSQFLFLYLDPSRVMTIFLCRHDVSCLNNNRRIYLDFMVVIQSSNNT